MSENILIRTFNVGFGDAIYVKIPDESRDHHMLIDYGSKGKAADYLTDVYKDLLELLPEDDNSKKVLDLMVVTHPHSDHIKGFDPEWFKDIRIKNIWLSAFMKDDHPQANQAHTLTQVAENASKSLLERANVNNLQLSPDLEYYLTNSLCNKSALEALKEKLPNSNSISPLYVARDLADILDDNELNKYDLEFTEGITCYKGFKEDKSQIKILAPEWDIDKYYAGEGSTDIHSLLKLQARHGAKEQGDSKIPFPENIGERDFRLLINRLMYTAMRFTSDDDDLKNNTSTVLLLEWRGRRLLFCGDAEFDGRGFDEDRMNSSWDVMYSIEATKNLLSKPIDFIKISHHGSVNGSPFFTTEGADQIHLKNLLPVGGEAQAVASTREHTGTWDEIPFIPLMNEYGTRIKNSRVYMDSPDKPQPPRTDREGEKWIDIEIEPLPGWDSND